MNKTGLSWFESDDTSSTSGLGMREGLACAAAVLPTSRTVPTDCDDDAAVDGAVGGFRHGGRVHGGGRAMPAIGKAAGLFKAMLQQ